MFTLYEHDGVFTCKFFMLHFVTERFGETILLALNSATKYNHSRYRLRFCWAANCHLKFIITNFGNCYIAVAVVVIK